MKVKNLDDVIFVFEAVHTDNIRRFEADLLAGGVAPASVDQLVADARLMWKEYMRRLPESLPDDILEFSPALRGLGARYVELEAKTVAETNGTVH